MKEKFLKWIKDPRNLIILVLIAICLFLGYCSQCNKSKCPEVSTDTVNTTTVVYDSVKVYIDVPKPKIVRDTLRYPEYVYMDVDTLAIILSYFTENFYDLVLKDDTSAYVRYCVSVWENELEPGKFEFINRRPTTINTTTINNNVITERKFKMFVGVELGGSTDRFSLAPELLFQYKSFMAGVGYDVINKEVRVPLFYKISLSKNKK